MKKSAVGITVFLMMICILSFGQKTISEGTLTYNISIRSLSNEPMTNALNGATVTAFLKGTMSRTDLSSSLGNEKTIHDSKMGTAVILKEYSGQKLMISLTKENWQAKNKKTEGLVFSKADETKELLGYQCVKATAQLNDSTTLSVFYAKDLVALNKEYLPMFKNLSGLPMQYEFNSGKLKFVYTITKIDFSSVPLAKFETPKAGYRVMSYDESHQGK
jgi:hypothetical protein